MDSFIQIREGKTPRKIHRDLDGLKDDESGRQGFFGRTVHFYRENDPTEYRAIGPLKPLDVPTTQLKPTDYLRANGAPMLMFYNDDCRILLTRRQEEMPHFVRNVDSDELWFVHTGSGELHTEYGRLSYRPGDYLYIPKATTYRQVPSEPGLALIIEATGEWERPEPTVIGRHYPFDSGLVTYPEAEVFTGDQDEYEIRLRDLLDEPTIIYAKNHPLDVAGWRGDNVAFSFNIEDYDALTSATVHLPPTVHLFMQATGVYVMNFLPRPAEVQEGVERVPWYHRNVDYDEIAFYHGGEVFGVDLPAGLISHAPQGVHHGVSERVRKRARRLATEYRDVEWEIIAIDTRKRLVPAPELVNFGD